MTMSLRGRPTNVAGASMRTGFRTAAAWLFVAIGAWLAAAPAQAASDPADPAFWYGRAADGSPRIKVYFFWTSRCPNCRAARPFLEDLPSRLPFVELVSRPTEGSAANARLQYSTAKALGADPTSVPAIFFCGEAQIGFDEATGVGASLVRRIEACRARLAADPGLLTAPVKVIPRDQRSDADNGGGIFAAVLLAAFMAMIVVGVVLSRRAAAAKEHRSAGKHGERKAKKKKR